MPNCSPLGPLRPPTFPNDEGYDELVLARAIPLRSGLRDSPSSRAEFFTLTGVPH
jgi:hypothetical protein